MSSPTKTLLSVALLLAGATAVTGFAGCRTARSARGRPAATSTAEALGTETPPEQSALSARPGESYTSIVDRNIFRPLVTAPHGPEGSPPPSTLAKDGSESSKAGGPGAKGGPPRPTDPLADLALTGVIQTGDQLQALIEHISTHTGRYLKIGEQIDGFRVKAIWINAVVLEKGGREYTLRMGSKTLSEPVAAPPPPNEGSAPPTPPPPAASGESKSGAFGEGMMSWADKMSLAQLEQMYASYKDQLSPEQRAQAEEYLARRRARGS